ncbi:methylmalonyl Co-A mutase-associated GTPase MeaB [Natronoglycomyces albus]|uniref:Methylmalonyl Co-A mutase-associated GTPase MeaB n=1 Tax=Natronoglycomyces albus TaxID=2811108 RepID=A0A895XTY9_9ACTN|nr:methylmalonyl Co-A mutase-associated GTPase MeaB [Natronoglycomyces albus]QSB05986.1 methylmalonyl Co-A mutase-associated GTPase MeaB [Natronoglycomyces albus]
MSRKVDVESTVRAAREGSVRAVARLLTSVENHSEQLPDIMAAVAAAHQAAGGRAAEVVGITGSPGVGKSTTTNALVQAWRKEGKRVAVLAVDPSSPFSGGAILGDRVRMQDHALDEGVYIRSMSSRGHLGGLTATTPQAVRLLEGMDFDVIVVETVGVGQAEVEIADLADTTLVLLAPGMGDGIQAVKAGILEIADLFVVNKSDRDGAAATVRDLRAMMALVRREPGQWRQPIVQTVAHEGTGIDEVIAEAAKHHQWLAQEDKLRVRRRERARSEITALVGAQLRRRYTVDDATAEAVAQGELDPYAAAEAILGRQY